jgi:rhodanese-related sulfurtransferase
VTARRSPDRKGRQIVKLITTEELRRKVERNDDFKLVMTLSEFAYARKHIAGTIHFETVADALAGLRPEEEIVVYCAGIHCAASIYAYRLLERAGYGRVRRYSGGIAEWEEAGHPLVVGGPEPRPAPSIAEPMRRRPRPAPARAGLHRPWYAWA